MQKLKKLIMKTTIKFLILFTVLISHSALGQNNQNRFESAFGYGFYQGFNIGLNYFYTDKLMAGLSVGSHMNLPPMENENHFNIQIEHTIHFGQLTKQNIGGWYFNQQLMYWEQGIDNDRWKIASLGLNIGRTISITKRLGLGLEIGPAFNLVIDRKRDPLAVTTGWMWPILYNGSAQFTYKF